MQRTEVRNLHGLAEGKWPTLDQFRFGVGSAQSQRVHSNSNLLTAVAVFKCPSAPRHFQSKFQTQCRQLKMSDPAHWKLSPVADAIKRFPKPDWARPNGQTIGDEEVSGQVPLVRAWPRFFWSNPGFSAEGYVIGGSGTSSRQTATWRKQSCLLEVVLALGEFTPGRGIILSRIRWSDSIERNSTWYSYVTNRSWKRSAA